MENYTLKELKKELENTDGEKWRKENEKEPNKIYYIIDDVYNIKSIKTEQKSEILTLSNYLKSRLVEKKDASPKSINLLNFGNIDFPICRTYYNYNAMDEVRIAYPDDEEKERISITLKYVEAFTKTDSKLYYYMEERGTQFDYIYNFISFYLRDASEEELEELKEIFYTCQELEPYALTRAKERQEAEAREQEKQENFISAFYTVFSNCLDFNIDLELNHEKAGGLKELQAYRIVEKIGKYNSFEFVQFDKLITYCNKYFIRYYNQNNRNNYIKDYTINLGREGSPVIYLRFTADSEGEAKKHFEELKRVVNADEKDITSIKQSYFGVTCCIRLWWD